MITARDHEAATEFDLCIRREELALRDRVRRELLPNAVTIREEDIEWKEATLHTIKLTATRCRGHLLLVLVVIICRAKCPKIVLLSCFSGER